MCGSGFGTFVFAPIAAALLETYDWKGANLILAGLILNCAVSIYSTILFFYFLLFYTDDFNVCRRVVQI